MGVRLPPRAPTLRKRSPVRTAFGNALPTSNRAVHFPTLLQKKYNHEYQAVSATRRRTSEQNVNEDPARAHKRTPRRGAWFAHSKSPRRIRICETASNALLSPAQDHSPPQAVSHIDRKSTRLNSSHANISYAVFCLKKKKIQHARSA